jgi:hypothetical protein
MVWARMNDKIAIQEHWSREHWRNICLTNYDALLYFWGKRGLRLR